MAATTCAADVLAGPPLRARRTYVAAAVAALAPVVTVEQTIADDGTADAVWMTGVGATGVAPPTLIIHPGFDLHASRLQDGSRALRVGVRRRQLGHLQFGIFG